MRKASAANGKGVSRRARFARRLPQLLVLLVLLVLLWPACLQATTDWTQLEKHEDALIAAFSTEFASPKASQCQQQRKLLDRFARLAPDALTVRWLQLACAEALEQTRKARRQRAALEKLLLQQSQPVPATSADLGLPLFSLLDARALGALLGESLFDVQLRLDPGWSRVYLDAIYVSESGHERRVRFEATARYQAQLQSWVADLDDTAEARRLLHQEMEVFAGWWIYGFWQDSTAGVTLAAAAEFAEMLGQDEAQVRKLYLAAIADDQVQVRVSYARHLLRARQRLVANPVGAIVDAFRGGGEQKLNDEIVDVLLPATESRYSDALVLMAALSHKGLILPQSTTQRDRFLRAYAKRRSVAEGDYRLARILLDQSLGLADPNEGRQRLVAAATAGYAPAWGRWSEVCEEHKKWSQCESGQLAAGLEAASKAGHAYATEILYDDRYPNLDAQERLKLLELAIRQGSRFAPYAAAAVLAEHWPRKLARRIELYRLAIARGDARGLHAMGRLFATGDGVKADPVQACFWYERAAERDQDKAMVALAGLLQEQQCGPERKDAAKDARKWLERAVELGNSAAQLNLAEHLRRSGKPADLARARKLLDLAVQAGQTDAYVSLAWMCEHGDGGPVDLECAAKFYQRGADTGAAESLNNLGRMYLAGSGVPQDSARALELFTAASEAGSVYAHCNLGLMLVELADAEQQRTGRTLIERAAEGGNAVCVIDLGEAYAYGRKSFEIDAVKANRWLEQAHVQDGGKGDGTVALANWLDHRNNPQRDPARAMALLQAHPVEHCVPMAAMWLRRRDYDQAIASLAPGDQAGALACEMDLAILLSFRQPPLRDLDRARKLLLAQPESDAVHFYLARLDLHAGQIDRALERLARMPEHNAFASYWLARYCPQRPSCPLDAEAARARTEALASLTGNDRNDLAWLLVADPLLDQPAAEFALGLMQGMPELENSPAWLDTLACAQARLGDFPAAVATSRRAEAAALKRGADTAFYVARSAELALNQACDHPY